MDGPRGRQLPTAIELRLLQILRENDEATVEDVVNAHRLQSHPRNKSEMAWTRSISSGLEEHNRCAVRSHRSCTGVVEWTSSRWAILSGCSQGLDSDVGFLAALIARNLYGGTLHDANGIPPLCLSFRGKPLELDGNAIAVCLGCFFPGGHSSGLPLSLNTSFYACYVGKD